MRPFKENKTPQSSTSVVVDSLKVFANIALNLFGGSCVHFHLHSLFINGVGFKETWTWIQVQIGAFIKWIIEMGTRLRRQVDKLDGQTELYLVLCLLGIALLMIVMLVACNCALTCCQCRSNRKRGKRRSREGNDDQYDDDYFHQIHSLLQRQQTVEHEWEERRRIRDEYRMVIFPLGLEHLMSNILPVLVDSGTSTSIIKSINKSSFISGPNKTQ